MSAGIEKRGNSLRMWINYQGQHIKEPLQLPATPENIEKARQWAELITLEIKVGRFDLARHFPNSAHIRDNQISHYSAIYLNQIRHDVAPSTYASYLGHVKNHINLKWGTVHPEAITTKQIRRWISQLKDTHSPKTVREIITRFAQIHAIWRDEHKIAYNPFENIVINQTDLPEPDPFTKSEIQRILASDIEPDLINLIPCLFWTGLSTSEQIAIAWEDIDLKNGTIVIRRSYVRGHYRVTKNRRRNRQIKLLQPAINALMQQYHQTGLGPAKQVEVLQRDNKTYKVEKLRFVWINAERGEQWEYHELRYRWNKLLKKAGVRHRGINQGRHTFASQLLSSGQVPPEWIAEQLGHSDTSMIYKHYGKLIAEDLPDYIGRINRYIGDENN